MNQTKKTRRIIQGLLDVTAGLQASTGFRLPDGDWQQQVVGEAKLLLAPELPTETKLIIDGWRLTRASWNSESVYGQRVDQPDDTFTLDNEDLQVDTWHGEIGRDYAGDCAMARSIPASVIRAALVMLDEVMAEETS